MKKLILILLLIPSLCMAADPIDWSKPYARMGVVTMGAGVAAAGQTNFVADYWQTFETDTIDDGNLEGTDNYSATSVAYTFSASAPTSSSTGEKATVSTVNSTADTGTRGIAADCDTGQRVTIDLNTYPTTQSVGFWVKTPTLSSDTFANIYGLGEDANPGCVNNIACVRLENNSGTYTWVLREDTTNSSTVAAAAGTWYWITVKFVKNGTTLMRVYSDAGSLIGSEVSVTGNDKATYYHNAGCVASSTGITYIDDIVIDLDGGTFPLGP